MTDKRSILILAEHLDTAADLCARIHPGAPCSSILRKNAAAIRARFKDQSHDQ